MLDRIEALEASFARSNCRKVADVSTQTHTASGRAHTSAKELLDVPANGSVIVREAHITMPFDVSDSYHSLVETFAKRHGSTQRPASQEIWDTPRYADMGEEERGKLVNIYICDQLDNPDFLELCKDMDNAWRRLALRPDD